VIVNTFWACKEHTHNNTLRCAICDEQRIEELESKLARAQLALRTCQGNCTTHELNETKALEKLDAVRNACSDRGHDYGDWAKLLIKIEAAIEGDET
jgi:hypothetical protein